jgi:hypothetical protein
LVNAAQEFWDLQHDGLLARYDRWHVTERRRSKLSASAV